MVMDKNYKGLYEATSAIQLKDEDLSFFPDLNLINNLRVSDHTLVQRNHVNIPQFQPDVLVPSAVYNTHEDYDFSDVVLTYISQMLMEENIEEKACMFQESAALQAAERSFYEVIGKKYPPSHNQEMPNLGQIDGRYPVDSSSSNYVDSSSSNYYSCISDVSDGLLCPNWNPDIGGDSDSSHAQHFPVDGAVASTSQSSHSSPSSSGTVTDAHLDSPVSSIQIPDIFSDSESIMQFKKGVEEASKFLPTGNSLLLDVRFNVVGKEDNEYGKNAVVKVENWGKHQSPEGSRGKKNVHHDDVDAMEERSNKQSAVFSESTVRSEMFDRVLLCSGGKNESALRESWQTVSSKNTPEDGLPKGSNGRKSRGKRQGSKRDTVDLRTILTLCAQAVAADDRRTANEFLKQIRQNSSSMGDGMQRLAHYVANGLEARMAGSGTQIYTALISMPTSAADVLKAYQLFLAACPFRKLSNFFSNKTIMNVAERAKTVHIIDFGIMYGFQWPCFIQRLSSRPGGPPKLRITGIDFPNPGFRPAERVEETGKRLANYAESFNVPFEFKAIAKKWETIKVEDLEIRKDEVLVVNCLYRFRNLLDETVVVNSPRDIVLNLIRMLKPDVFIQGIVNGAYNAPFFITRFREALFHYSSVFDMLEANIPREIHERMLIEKIIFGREVMNVVACEAAERIERPETYKQWKVRNIRAGFRQLPLNEEIRSTAKERVKAYHKDFVIDVDGHWLLQGWKGRIVYALSTWKAAY
ncbi:scarecrow-like protein 14 [Nicotiana sylvestris]|uniref:Scarecrow-like protein 14 n=1 Tax=Nicotiana sylvestris TaxID=4096 RepID=A0A1U7V7H1_NICSY|nr:PREDICTED: scarecrow-like protein 14 [Nicotiana sylvestris]XP_009764082.1 PREDICTED: scarecrow-like protein 14 [Nicotiana sylvestris]